MTFFLLNCGPWWCLRDLHIPRKCFMNNWWCPAILRNAVSSNNNQRRTDFLIKNFPSIITINLRTYYRQHLNKRLIIGTFGSISCVWIIYDLFGMKSAARRFSSKMLRSLSQSWKWKHDGYKKYSGNQKGQNISTNVYHTLFLSKQITAWIQSKAAYPVIGRILWCK